MGGWSPASLPSRGLLKSLRILPASSPNSEEGLSTRKTALKKSKFYFIMFAYNYFILRDKIFRTELLI